MFMFTFSWFHYNPVHFSHHDMNLVVVTQEDHQSLEFIIYMLLWEKRKAQTKSQWLPLVWLLQVMIFSLNFVNFVFERMRQLMGLSVIALSQRVMRVREPVDRHCDYAREIIAPSSFGRAKLNCPLSLGLRSIGGSQRQPLHRRLSSKSASGSQNSWWQTAHVNYLWEIMGRRRKRSSGMLECHAERQRLYMELW